MSTISHNSKGRTSLRGRQSGPNSGYSGRSGSKRSSSDRFLPDGVYGNSRFTHVIYSLVGCVVQVQVKNGSTYEGVFRTVSPEMNIVLELAHKLEDNKSSIPSRDRLIDKLIFGKDDVVALSAVNVDLDYAVKDSFTDAAISSRYNGQSYDRDPRERELMPWDGETGDDTNLLENDSSNGWDPNEMFKTNAEQFSVRSTYDENLTQYTTPLEKKDTKEYRQREEEAARLAKEIERSDEYKARIDLENGDGDEEAKFSSVVRPSEMRGGPSGNGSGKYIPPHNRRGPGMGPRRAASDHAHAQRQISPTKSLQTSVVQHTQQIPTLNTSLGVKDEHIHPVNSTNINGEKEEKQSEPILNKSSPEGGTGVASQQSVTAPPADKAESPPNTNSVTPPSKDNRQNPNRRGRQIADLKEFQENFKLNDKKGGGEEPEKEDDDKDETKPNIAERSKLNPMAREFVPTGQSRSQNIPQTPTPPRPQTQSPVVQPMVPTIQYSPYIIPANMMSVGPPQPGQNQATRPYPKRAVVSVQPRSDFTAAAQHATGQPLLANATVPTQQYLPYQVMPSVMHQQSAASYQVMPVTANQRMMAPNQVGATNHPSAGLDPSQANAQQSHPPQQFFMPGHGPVPAHMTHHHGQQLSHPQPAHVGGHTVAGNHQGQGQMTPVSGPHPAPSPVQHGGPGGQQHLPQGPPTSGTPQPQLNYPQMGLQGHQMQGPSHNPASPQATMHPVSLPYALTSHPHIQQGAAQQFTFTQATQQQTSGSQTMHSHTHSPHMPQLVVMPQPPTHSQVQHSHHLPQQFQHSSFNAAAAAAAGHHLQGPTPVHGQGHHLMPHSGIPALPVTGPSGVHSAPVHHFVPSVASHGQGGPVQTGYPQPQ